MGADPLSITMTKKQVAKMVKEAEKRARSCLATYTPSEAKMRIKASTVLLLCKLSKIELAKEAQT